MIILIHSSKTMRSLVDRKLLLKHSQPEFIDQANTLVDFINRLNLNQLKDFMKISSDLAVKVQETYKQWGTNKANLAIKSFTGDIYSGLQADEFSSNDLEFAQKHLRIISGLYGILKPLDLIKPYRLEMAYRLKGFNEPNLYKFWNSKLAESLGGQDYILNLSSNEYYKAVAGHLDAEVKVITPKFLTVDSKTNQPKFAAVHAKIARGAFAGWVIRKRLIDSANLNSFNQLGYLFSPELSLSEDQPVFVCKHFGGKGLSLRLK